MLRDSLESFRVKSSTKIQIKRVYSSHESSSSRESSSSHESGSSQVQNFFFFFFFFDYTNDVRAVTRNINFPVGDICSFSIKRAITSASCRCFTKIHDNFFAHT